MSEIPYCTPKKPSQHLLNNIKIPASPFMKKIGYGTGVAVYELQRSPIYNNIRSPWAIKKLINRKTKKIDNCLKERLKNEAEILRSLVHPNIVGFRLYSEESNLLAMEECTVGLGDLIEDRADNNEGPFSVKSILKVCSDVAKALSYLHNTALLMHCDLKSFNVLIKDNFQICKLCDFGVCLPVNKTGCLDTEKAPNGEYEGTKSWNAPEILKYPAEITVKADIYSYGLIIWEMIALSPPLFEDLADAISGSIILDESSLDELFENLSSRQRPPIPENVNLGTEYEGILELYYCCTHEEKSLRPTADQLLTILQEIKK